MNSIPSFWRWFNGGSGLRGGWRKFLDRWLPFHALVGATLAVVVPYPLEKAATAVLLPLAGVFVGMSFAWAGNAQALMQAPEISEIAEHNEGGFEEYVYTFQAAVLTILATMALWGVAGLGVFDRKCFFTCPPWGYGAAKWALYFMSSVTLRECWQVVLGAQWMLLAQRAVRRLPEERKKLQ